MNTNEQHAGKLIQISSEIEKASEALLKSTRGLCSGRETLRLADEIQAKLGVAELTIRQIKAELSRNQQ